MVFSFFKKPPEKMPERPAARPRPQETPSVAPPPAAAPASLAPLELEAGEPARPPEPPAPAPLSQLPDLDFTAGALDQELAVAGTQGIEVEHGQDALQADIEQVVVLFANGQDSAARGLLESHIQHYPCVEGKRFWQLLFDLLQVTGDRAGFEALGVEFARRCETSPPTWRAAPDGTPVKADGSQKIALQGVLNAGDGRLLDLFSDLVSEKIDVVLDFGRLAGCDEAVSARLAELLTQARRLGRHVNLSSCEAFINRLDERLPVGRATHEGAWQLLLELLQRQGTQERFEARAIDYAVTFERSPPSWEAPPAPRAASPAAPVASGAPEAGSNVFRVDGEIRHCRFPELAAWLETQSAPIVDFSAVRRLDFYSAGQLVNRLAAGKAAGKLITLRGTNHLIAELLAIVGLQTQAQIILPKS